MTIDCSKCLDRGSCCGPVRFKKEFIEKHKDKIQVIFKEIPDSKGIWPIPEDGLACIFLNRQTKECMIYEDRPEVCKIFGEEILPCPYYKRSGNPRSKASQKKVMKHFDKQLRFMEKAEYLNRNILTHT